MEFWDAVKAAIVANLVALIIAPTIWVATYTATKKYGNRVQDSLARSSIRISLTTRFYWLVLWRKKSREEYRTWISAETNRRLLVGLVFQASMAPSLMFKSMFDGLSDMFSKEQFERVRPRYAKNMLDDALRSMSMKDIETANEQSFLSLQPHERAKWLCSQSYSRLSEWALRLDARDREAWQKWLSSSDATNEIEEALRSEQTEEPAS